MKNVFVNLGKYLLCASCLLLYVTSSAWAQGNVISQGDKAQGSDRVRNNFGVSGKGIKIGIISDSFFTLGQGDPNELPSKLSILLEGINQTGKRPLIDEGRGLAEIIHDIAPDAEVLFHTGFGQNRVQEEMVTAINELANQGCDIIVDDVFYPEEPIYQDGIINQTIDKVVNDNGITYVSLAGNFARGAAEYVYTDANTLEGRYQEFDDGEIQVNTEYLFYKFRSSNSQDIYYQNVKINNGETIIVQWNDPYASACDGCPGAENDFDVFFTGTNVNLTSDNLLIRDTNKAFVIKTSDNRTLDPIEFDNPTVFESNLDQNGQATIRVWFARKKNTPLTRNEVLFRIVLQRSSGRIVNAPSPVPSTLVPHGNAEKAITVGAVDYRNTPAFDNTISNPSSDGFSSLGGMTLFYDAQGNPINGNTLAPRNKPDICAPNNVNTSFFGDINPGDVENDGLPNFRGTSASAPHIAGLVALYLEMNPSLCPDDIKQLLLNNALDMDNPDTPIQFDAGFDFASGQGLVQGFEAASDIDLNLNVPIRLSDAEGTNDIANTSDDLATLNDGDQDVEIMLPEGVSAAFFNLGIEALLELSCKKTVTFTLEGPGIPNQAFTSNEKTAPYSLFGDYFFSGNGNNLRGNIDTDKIGGAFTLQANQPYTIRLTLAGQVLNEASFILREDQATQIRLLDADGTNNSSGNLALLQDGDQNQAIDLPNGVPVGSFNLGIEALLEPSIPANPTIRFELVLPGGNTITSTEGRSPYSFFGDNINLGQAEDLFGIKDNTKGFTFEFQANQTYTLRLFANNSKVLEASFFLRENGVSSAPVIRLSDATGTQDTNNINDDLADLTDGTQNQILTLPAGQSVASYNLGVEAILPNNPSNANVNFSLNQAGTVIHTKNEGAAPFSMFGDSFFSGRLTDINGINSVSGLSLMANQEYTVIVSIDGQVASTASFTLLEASSSQATSQGSLVQIQNTYPNAWEGGTLKLRLTDQVANPAHYTLTNQLGHVVSQGKTSAPYEQELSIDLSQENLNPGVYYLIIAHPNMSPQGIRIMIK